MDYSVSDNNIQVFEGLKGVIAGQSAISSVGLESVGLNYRGYPIAVLCENCSFEEVAYLLFYGDLPTANELELFNSRIFISRSLTSEMKQLLKLVPKSAHPMDVMIIGCAFLGTIDPEEDPLADQMRIAISLLGKFPSMLLYWYSFTHFGVEINECTDKNDSIVEHFYKLLKSNSNKKITPLISKCLNISLILYAEHDFNASTFAARITTSTLSDIYSSICSAISTLKGPLHGGANEAAMAMLQKMTSPEEARIQVLEKLDKKQLLMGFGHRLYKRGDPRSPLIKKCSRELSESPYGQPLLYEISNLVENLVFELKGMHPNLDFYSASVYSQCEIPTKLFTPLFVISRVTGWAAHIFEQRKNNRLIRPSSLYIGPPQKSFTRIDDRKSSPKIN